VRSVLASLENIFCSGSRAGCNRLTAEVLLRRMSAAAA
jgi:hypothetical protein